MNNDCDNLDAYLDGDLSAHEASRFRAHLDGCGACREAVAQQGWIDVLLQSPERIQLETPPADLVYSIHSSLNIRRRNARLIAGGLAVAAALLLAVGWIFSINRPAERGPNIEVAAVAPRAPVEAVVPKHRESTVVGGPDVIIVPLMSRHPGVTVVRVFQTYQPEISTHASTEQPPATDDFVWPDDFSGG